MNEVVPVKMRAGLVDIHAVCLLFGYFVQGWVGFGFYFWKDGIGTPYWPIAPVKMLTSSRGCQHLATTTGSAMCLASHASVWFVLDSRKPKIPRKFPYKIALPSATRLLCSDLSICYVRSSADHFLDSLSDPEYLPCIGHERSCGRSTSYPRSFAF